MRYTSLSRCPFIKFKKQFKMSKTDRPPWKVESSRPAPVLKLYNSFTRQKEVFIPKSTNKVLWYSCGPTVYDASHMGHARSYISFDILRRVLTDYFRYDVMYVMNITDIDDKIIKRARKDHLFNEYKNEKRSAEIILKDSQIALDMLLKKIKETKDSALEEMLKLLAENMAFAIRELETEIKKGNEEIIEASTMKLLDIARDPLSDKLDVEKGSSISDNSIFSSLPRYWEGKFHEDMDALNILRPDVLTRVSEYIPEIIAYINIIIDNNMAYVSNGSVYFNVHEFHGRPNHNYAKLVPEAYGNIGTLEEGEGELTDLKEKQSPTDFALWKVSKPGEPWWDSPWGKGRPGWHIECSVMASAICGDSLDIHTGGVDLKFPHHDNEIAQAEAYFDNDSWVRYFLHSGHLTISGCKMSKSLKNFITISDALKQYTARQLRFAFLLHSWRETLDYSKNSMDHALSYEKMCNEFFLNVKATLHSKSELKINDLFIKWNSDDLGLNDIFLQTKDAINVALCDNIDTKTVLDKIRDCISSCNTYMANDQINIRLLVTIASYFTNILNIFGIDSERERIGFSLSSTTSVNSEEILLPYLRVLNEFRHEVRTKVKVAQDMPKESRKALLECCDILRDDKLPQLGVRLEDREGKSSVIKLVDKTTLLKEKQMKEQIKLDIEEAKLKKKAADSQKEELKTINPKEMFLHMTDKYSAFDDGGLPTHDSDGKEISKGLRKKLKKLQETQEKKYVK